MKSSFSTGLVILIPFALAIWVLNYLFDFFTNPLYQLMEHLFFWYQKKQGDIVLHHENIIRFLSRVVALILTFVLIVLLGFLGRRLFFRSLMKGTSKLMLKIPIIGTIYQLTKEITKAMLASDQKAFKETVLVPFPSPESHTLGFVTGTTPAQLQEKIPEADVTVFIPTAPHPISGYVLFCPRSALHSTSISVEDTFKFLISCGTLHPPSRGNSKTPIRSAKNV